MLYFSLIFLILYQIPHHFILTDNVFLSLLLYYFVMVLSILYMLKKDHTGFELWEVREMVNKYKGQFKLDTVINDIFFTHKLTVYYK